MALEKSEQIPGKTTENLGQISALVNPFGVCVEKLPFDTAPF